MTEARRGEQEKDIAETSRFAADVLAVPRVLPDVAFRDELTFWRGGREFRLFSVTGDATGSTVLYLPAEKILVTGDVLVSPPDGQGPPPWTTNSYTITPWLTSLRRWRRSTPASSFRRRDAARDPRWPVPRPRFQSRTRRDILQP